MERESSSDEDDDRQNLIHHNNETDKSPKRPSIFHISNDTTRANSGNSLTLLPNFAISKKYLLLIFFSLFILILYLTTGLRNLFSISSIRDTKLDSPIDNRMRESELQALYLLKQQQLGLFSLWNRTISLNNTGGNPNSNFESDLLSQISLNKKIQLAILSAHQFGNDLGLNDNVSDPLNINRCGKSVQNLSDRKLIEWKPLENKYLFAICASGQMSNHLICLEKHMFFAALLNRVLVIPSSKVDFQYNRVLDIEHINKCLGRRVVVTFEEFEEAKKGRLRIDKFVCYFSLPQPCYLDDGQVKKLKSLGVSMDKLEPAWVEDVKNPSKKTMQDVVSKFTCKDDVIAVGDVFFADVEREMVMQPGGPLVHRCKTLIEPSHLIMITAQRFVQTFLGERFIALHFRRHGFLKFCNAKSPSCFFPIPQAADCISRLVEKANTPVIYLSTDAAESETDLLQSLIMLNGKTVPLVKRPPRNFAEKWDALLYRHKIEGDPQVEAMLDKTISAMSSVFIGASGSTFTEDILRLRKDWGSASMCDEYLCQGETPNFIADNE